MSKDKHRNGHILKYPLFMPYLRVLEIHFKKIVSDLKSSVAASRTGRVLGGVGR